MTSIHCVTICPCQVLSVCLALCPSLLETLTKDKSWQCFIIDLLIMCQSRYCRHVSCYLGCLPFSQKIWKCRFKVKWKGNFPENPFGNCGLPPEVVLFFLSERNIGNCLTICFNFPFPGPFKDLRTVLVVGQYGSLMESAISSGWSAYSENPLPLCNGHTNRIFLTNGKHP